MNPRPKVLFIGGAGRSGSTLMLRMLGELDGYFAAGDLTQLWQRGLLEDQLCGCGKPFSECEVWQGITKLAIPDFDRAKIERIQAIKTRVCHTANLPRVLIPSLRTPAFEAELQEYSEAMRRVYQGIIDHTGSEVILDGSKNPGDAAVLAMTGIVDLHILHLVRDSRGVANSWLRKKTRPEIHWKTEHMSVYPWFTTSMAWNIYNGLFEVLGRRFGKYLRVRYEDFVMRPTELVDSITDFVGHGSSSTLESRFVAPDRVELSPNHTVSGNPMRFEVGDIQLREDVGWHDELATAKKVAITAVTLPFLRRYAYRPLP